VPVVVFSRLGDPRSPCFGVDEPNNRGFPIVASFFWWGPLVVAWTQESLSFVRQVQWVRRNVRAELSVYVSRSGRK